MTTRSLTRSRGLHMSLLGLTASASIVAGVFVAAAPAYSDDGVPDVSASCLVATEEDATVRVSSILHAGEPVHAEGSGWGPSSGTTRGFVIVTLDDGKERRPADTNLPDWVPAAVARDRSAWAVLEVGADGSFSADIAVPSTWEVGSGHQIAIGDGVTGTYVTVSVTVVDEQVAVRSCSLAGDDPTPADPDQGGDATEPGGDAAIPGGGDPSLLTVMPPEVPAEEQADPVTASQVVRTQTADDASDDAQRRSGTDEASSPSPSASSGAPSARGSSSAGGAGAPGGSSDPTPQASASTEQQSVSASQIGPKSHTEQQANDQAAREEEGRLNGWILAGGGLLALLGAVVTVSIVRRPHAGVH